MERQADLALRLPPGAVPLDLDSAGPADPDVETVLPAIKARGHVLELVTIARRLNDQARRDEGRDTIAVRRPRPAGGTVAVPRFPGPKYDPQLLEETSLDRYRLRVYPIESGTVYALVSPEESVEIGREPGSPHRVDVTFVQKLTADAGLRRMDWGVAISGRRMKLPRGTLRLLLPACERFQDVTGAVGRPGVVSGRIAYEIDFDPAGGGAKVTLGLRIGPAVVATAGAGHGHEGCDHEAGYDVAWIREALEADARIDEMRRLPMLTPVQVKEIEETGVKYKLVNRWTSILRVDSNLYTHWRRVPHQPVADKIDK